MDAARATGGGECAGRGGRTGLPDRATGTFPDLEGPGGASGGATGGRLTGAPARGDGAGTHHPFAAGRRRECMVPERFLDLMDGREGHAICRRHRCGGTGPRSVMERHGTEWRRVPEPGAMTCPFPAATGAFAFPMHADGIRDMAGWPRFRRRRRNAGAAPAFGPYPRYAGDPEAGRAGMGMARTAAGTAAPPRARWGTGPRRRAPERHGRGQPAPPHGPGDVPSRPPCAPARPGARTPSRMRPRR